MATFKTTWLFEQTQLKAGWSETWYVVAADKPTAHNASIAVALKRVSGLVSECTLTWVRTSANLPLTTPPPNPPRQRDVLISAVNLPGQMPSSFGAAVPWVAGLVRWQNQTSEVFRTQLIRGLPGNAYDNDSDKIAASVCNGLISQMIGTMGPNGFTIAHHVRGGATSYVVVQQGIYERISRRATGRPFFLPRGRRSKKTT